MVARRHPQHARRVRSRTRSRFRVEFGSGILELFGFCRHSSRERLFFGDALFGRVFSYVFCYFHGNRSGTAHAAEMSRFCSFLRERFIMERAASCGRDECFAHNFRAAERFFRQITVCLQNHLRPFLSNFCAPRPKVAP